MSYDFGIEKSQEVLAYLSSDEDIETKLDKAFDTITLIGEEDTTIDCLKAIIEWSEKYSNLQGFGLKQDGLQSETNKDQQLEILFKQLQKLCNNIINSNSFTDL